MGEDTGRTGSNATEMGLTLEELIQREARELIQNAIEIELRELLAEYGNVRTLTGKSGVIRNGYLPAREIPTTVGAVEVRVHKVCDCSGAGVKFNSALVPPYVRRSRRISGALPWLYLWGALTAAEHSALAVMVGESARGLPPNAVNRLKTEWTAECRS